jgi:hypothetical protein
VEESNQSLALLILLDFEKTFDQIDWKYLFDVVTLALGSRPRQRLARARAKRSVRECEDEDSHSQVSSHFGSWNLDGLPNLQRTITEVKTPRIEKFFISLESY